MVEMHYALCVACIAQLSLTPFPFYPFWGPRPAAPRDVCVTVLSLLKMQLYGRMSTQAASVRASCVTVTTKAPGRASHAPAGPCLHDCAGLPTMPAAAW